ncbi:Transient receptor potential channel pyrexia [Orchesella cincta]|uniref:Transient receptor potential channel pyrexia n=1 Tax=Orchesella cincta TaxID=48709 RepID=A0A1D2MBP6_ORCCI|nr:Transient receptor potential channel pyrexia [Orchesella cincta]
MRCRKDYSVIFICLSTLHSSPIYAIVKFKREKKLVEFLTTTMEENENNVALQRVTIKDKRVVVDSSKYTKQISLAVQSGSLSELENYLYDNAPDNILNSVNEKGRSPLHDACDCEKKKVASELVTLLLNWYLRRNPKLTIASWIRRIIRVIQLSITLSNEETGKQFMNYLNVEQINNAGEEAITPIYELFPDTIITLLDGPNSIEFVEDEDEPSERDLKIKFLTFKKFLYPLCVITGIGNDSREVYETYMLSNVFRLDKESRIEITMSPIVELFLDLKWEKMQYLIYISMAFHIFWSVFSSIYIMNVFMSTYENNTEEKFNESQKESNVVNPHFNSANIGCSSSLLVLTTILALKEIFECRSTPKMGSYWRQSENKGQWALILFIYLLVIFCTILPVWLDYITSIAAVFTAWLLVLGQLNKHPSLGLYMEMLMKVSKSFMKMLLPSEEKFHLWHLGDRKNCGNVDRRN